MQYQANRILAKIAVHPDHLMPREQRQIYFAWVCSSINSTEQDAALLTLTALQELLRQADYRRSFFEYANAMRLLQDVLKRDATAPANIQIQYGTLLVLWTLTFDAHIAGVLDQGTTGLIADIATVMSTSRKEKVIRMCLATLANLLTKPTEPALVQKNAEQMISRKVSYMWKRSLWLERNLGGVR